MSNFIQSKPASIMENIQRVLSNKKGFSAVKPEKQEIQKPQTIAPKTFLNNKIFWIMLVSIVALITIVISLLVFFLTRNSPTVIILKVIQSKTQINQNQMSVLQQTTAKLTDPSTIGKDKQLQVYAFKTYNKVQNRLLQGGSQNQSSSNEKLNTKTTGSSLQFRDKQTGITISIVTGKGDINVGVPINNIVQYVLRNQPNQQEPENNPRNLQETSQSQVKQEQTTDKKLTYYNLPQKVSEEVRKVLISKNPQAKAVLGQTYDAKYDEKNAAFTIVNQIKPQIQDPDAPSKTAQFHNPKNTPVISNLLNENQIAKAVGKVVDQVITKVKQIATKDNIDLLQKKADIKLPQKQANNGNPSIYFDQSDDIVKVCTGITSDSIRCTKDGYTSGLISLNVPKDPTIEPVSTSTLLVRTTLAIQ